MLTAAGLHRQRTPHQAQIACACGYSRPWSKVLLPASCAKGQHASPTKVIAGDSKMGMTVMAHNAATVVRIQHNRLSKRAQKLRQLLRLKRHNPNEFKAKN